MEKKTWIIIGVVAFVLIVIGSFMPDAERLIYTNDVLYDCKEGTYYFPASEQIFEKVSEVGFIDYQSNSKDNVCIFSLNYKVKVAPTDNPSYEISFDTCKITVSQLAYFKEKKADLFHIITIAVTLALFIFILRTKGTFGEVRWYYPLMLGAFVCVSRGGIFISQFFKKYSKNISAIILILLIFFPEVFKIFVHDDK